jgi:2-polyprenyl-6-methoxyphenol hydroxylase-like FAD-dependent oxidoreductase
MSDKIETPVLIAGGGPVGMTLALNLARYGIRSIVVERNATTTRHPKMDLPTGCSGTITIYRCLLRADTKWRLQH